jgi:anti-anti-sigma factor
MAIQTSRVTRQRELSQVPFAVGVTHADRWCQLTLEGELDLATAPVLELELARAEKRSPRLVIVDLRRLAFMDVGGMRVLLAAARRAKRDGYELAIVRGASVQRLFELTGVDSILNLIDDPASTGQSPDTARESPSQSWSTRAAW